MSISSNSTPYVTINSKNFVVMPNPALFKRDKEGNILNNSVGDPLFKSRGDLLTDYAGTSSGSYKLLKLLQQVTILGAYVLKQIGSLFFVAFESVAGKLKTTLGALSIPRLWEVSAKARKVVGEWINKSSDATSSETRVQLEKISTVADAVATWGFVGVFFTGSAILAVAAAVPSLIGDVVDLTMAATDWTMARSHIDILENQHPSQVALHNRFRSTLVHAAVVVMKTALAVFSGVVGFMSLAAGAPILSVPTSIAIGLFAVISAIGLSYYEKTMPYPKVDFFKIRQPEILVAGVPGY